MALPNLWLMPFPAYENHPHRPALLGLGNGRFIVREVRRASRQ
jgi:hypothetical protein